MIWRKSNLVSVKIRQEVTMKIFFPMVSFIDDILTTAYLSHYAAASAHNEPVAKISLGISITVQDGFWQ